MAAKIGIETALSAYNTARNVAQGAGLLASVATAFGLVNQEEEKKFEPNQDPYDDNDISNQDAILATDLDRQINPEVNPQVKKPSQEQDLPETEIEDQKFKLDVQGLIPLTEEEMLINYRPEPGEQLRQHVRNYLLFEEADRYFSNLPQEEMEQIQEDDFEAVSMNDTDSQTLLLDFGEQLSQSDEIDIRRVDPEQARTIQQTIRRVFPSIDSTSARRLTKAVIILSIAKQIPFGQMYNFIKDFGTTIWEWIVTRNPPNQQNPNGSDFYKVFDDPVPPQCIKKIVYRDGRIIRILICSDERGVRYYES